MGQWTLGELEQIDSVRTYFVRWTRDDGTPTRDVPIWAVRVGSQVYVRSVRGRTSTWFRRATQWTSGELVVGRDARLVRAVAFHEARTDVDAAVSEAYRSKYGDLDPRVFEPTLAAIAVAAALQVSPA